ncbi:MAG: hypothetical protein FJZ87_16860 [Chloroflexi bacterium]|nr:hypothetical protein [Chloroflexota bacterium]
MCSPLACDPAESAQLQSYTAGDIEFSCPVFPEPTLEPSEENCPPGTYYAPVTNRCIDIQVPQGDGTGGSEGGSSGGCSLTTDACTAQGQSFDSNTCGCVDIQ